MTLFRQGDVLLESIERSAIPTDAVPVERVRGRVVLAEGETTGHEHAIPDPDVSHFRKGGDQFIEVGEEGATLVHEEHGPIDLDPGAYKVTGQREYEPSSRTGGYSRPVYD